MSTRSQAGAAGRPGEHVREHASILASIEKQVLVRIARRLPPRLTPDHLTALGSVAMAGAGAAFAAASLDPRALVLVPPLLALNWFGDSLDGTVARVRRHERPRYGYYLDHAVDLANAVLLFGGMALSGLMYPELALGLLAGYLLLCAESFLATHSVGVFRISFGVFGPTELRLVLAAGALAALDHRMVSPFGIPAVRLFDLGGVIALAGMAAVFVISATRAARTLAVLEPPHAGRP